MNQKSFVNNGLTRRSAGIHSYITPEITKFLDSYVEELQCGLQCPENSLQMIYRQRIAPLVTRRKISALRDPALKFIDERSFEVITKLHRRLIGPMFATIAPNWSRESYELDFNYKLGGQRHWKRSNRFQSLQRESVVYSAATALAKEVSSSENKAQVIAGRNYVLFQDPRYPAPSIVDIHSLDALLDSRGDVRAERIAAANHAGQVYYRVKTVDSSIRKFRSLVGKSLYDSRRDVRAAYDIVASRVVVPPSLLPSILDYFESPPSFIEVDRLELHNWDLLGDDTYRETQENTLRELVRYERRKNLIQEYLENPFLGEAFEFPVDKEQLKSTRIEIKLKGYIHLLSEVVPFEIQVFEPYGKVFDNLGYFGHEEFEIRRDAEQSLREDAVGLTPFLQLAEHLLWYSLGPEPNRKTHWSEATKIKSRLSRGMYDQNDDFVTLYESIIPLGSELLQLSTANYSQARS